MKKPLLLLLVVLLVTHFSFSQTRYAFVDIQYILETIPEYQVVKNQIDALSSKWQKDLDVFYLTIDSMNNKLKVDQVFLSLAMKNKKQNDISRRQIDLKKLEHSYFGEKGELYKKKQELLKPILDDIFDAIKDIATLGNYGAIYDRSAGLSVVYFNPNLDKSDDVLEKLGYKTN
jgi:outer membrane protein